MVERYHRSLPTERGYAVDVSTFRRDHLRALLQERGMTPRALSRAVGDNPFLVRDILAGKSRNPRADTLMRLARELGVSQAELLNEADTSSSPRAPELIALPVRDRVQAGAWLQADDSVQTVPARYPAARDPRYARAEQWLSVVVGDSVDRLLIFDGDYVHVVDAIDIGYAPRTGDVVEVERTRHDGQLRELTIKQVEVTPGGVLLWPRSHNKRWSEPLNLQDGAANDDDIEVRIRGLVIATIRRL